MAVLPIVLKILISATTIFCGYNLFAKGITSASFSAIVGAMFLLLVM
ncbi:MAG: hypothetical protein IID18_03375 [Nitrospinae bacterium]|nr:hypothetical protein [Nitrospinota bacterium]